MPTKRGWRSYERTDARIERGQDRREARAKEESGEWWSEATWLEAAGSAKGRDKWWSKASWEEAASSSRQQPNWWASTPWKGWRAGGSAHDGKWGKEEPAEEERAEEERAHESAEEGAATTRHRRTATNPPRRKRRSSRKKPRSQRARATATGSTSQPSGAKAMEEQGRRPTEPNGAEDRKPQRQTEPKV